MKKWIIGLMALVLSVVAPAAARAHEGHAHKVMGTVSSISGKNLMVKGTDGKTVMVMLDAKTKITQGTRTVDVSVVKVGDRVVAEGPEQKEMIMAATLKIGDAAPAVTKK